VAHEQLPTPEEIQEFENNVRIRVLGAVPDVVLPRVRVSKATQTTPATSRTVSPITTSSSMSAMTTTTATSSRTSVLPPPQTGSSGSGTASSLSARRTNVPSELRISNIYDCDGFCHGPLTGSDSPLTKDSDQRFFNSDSGSTSSRRGDEGPRQPTILLPGDAGQFFQRGTTPSGTISHALKVYLTCFIVEVLFGFFQNLYLLLGSARSTP
jgi:hypothetical protein